MIKEVGMKKCMNQVCRAEFIPQCKTQKYCSAKCRCHDYFQRKALEDKTYREKKVASVMAWRKANPDAVKKMKAKSRAKNYRDGKLPKWMYD